MTMTDFDLLVITQIAYYDFQYDILRANGYNAAIRELLKQDMMIRIRLERTLLRAREKEDRYKIYRAEHAIWLYDQITAESSVYGDWILKAVKDDNEQSGFYGCLLETAEGEAVVGFRGSESTDANQIEKDWIDADLGLLNADFTEQQVVASEFMEEIDSYYTYDRYDISGHSLGGNLAAHATVTAPEGMKGKIGRSISFDGPGFSNEYLAVQKERITGVCDKLYHYQWSLVGNLLFSLPGSTCLSVRTGRLVYENYAVEALLQKHDTGFVQFTQKGAVIPGDMDVFAREIGNMTRSIETCPVWMGNMVVGFISKLIRMPKEERKPVAISLMNTLGVTAVRYPVPAVTGMVVIGAFLLIGHIEPDFFGKTVIPTLCRTISDVIDTGETIVSIVKKVLVYTEEQVKPENRERINGQAVYLLSDMYNGYEHLI